MFFWTVPNIGYQCSYAHTHTWKSRTIDSIVRQYSVGY